MAAAASSQPRCVFVGNIPYDATEEQLIQICEEVGPVVSFRLVHDRDTGKPKGYGFCEFKDEETALSARRNLKNYEINGRQLRVDFAESDKGVDRNREQGRGGPGFTSTAEAQKMLPGPPVPGDNILHQPIGLPLASTASSTMARTLGGPQTSSLPSIQNNLGNDPLTHYLAKMSRQQLHEIMSEIKALAGQNKPLAQQLLGIPQLSKALFQAQIMLGMVSPQMMASAQQSLSSIQSKPPAQLPVGPLVRPPVQNPPYQHVPIRPPFQQPMPPRPQIQPQGVMLGQSGPPARPQSFINHPQIPPLPNTNGLPPRGHPSLVQHSRPVAPTNIQQPYFSHPNAAQAGPSTSNNHGLSWAPRAWAPRANTPPTLGVRLAEQRGGAGEISLQTKRPRLEEGGGAHPLMTSSFPATSSVTAQQNVASKMVKSSVMNNADVKQQQQMPQLAPEVESALLQQVMSLTPEKLSSLPPEQQQQVLQLQQMLVANRR